MCYLQPQTNQTAQLEDKKVGMIRVSHLSQHWHFYCWVYGVVEESKEMASKLISCLESGVIYALPCPSCTTFQGRKFPD